MKFFLCLIPGIVAFLLFLFAPLAGETGQIYKWRDASGRLQFSDTSPSEEVKPEVRPSKPNFSVVPSSPTPWGGFKKSFPNTGHGQYVVVANVNGTPVRFLVDTGATLVTINAQTAQRVGLNPKKLVYSLSSETANGRVHLAPVTLNIQIDSLRLHGVQGAVNGSPMNVNLLGMSFFSRLKRFQAENGVMTIYWEANQTRQ